MQSTHGRRSRTGCLADVVPWRAAACWAALACLVLAGALVWPAAALAQEGRAAAQWWDVTRWGGNMTDPASQDPNGEDPDDHPARYRLVVRANPPDGPFNTSTDQPTSALNAVDAASESTFVHLRKRAGDVPYGFRRLILLSDVRTPAAARHIADLITEDLVLVCCKRMPADWAAFVDAPGSVDLSTLRERFAAAVDRGQVIDARADGLSHRSDTVLGHGKPALHGVLVARKAVEVFVN